MTKIRQSHVSWEGQPRRHQRGSRKKKKSHRGKLAQVFSGSDGVLSPGVSQESQAAETLLMDVSRGPLCVWGCQHQHCVCGGLPARTPWRGTAPAAHMKGQHSHRDPRSGHSHCSDRCSTFSRGLLSTSTSHPKGKPCFLPC